MPPDPAGQVRPILTLIVVQLPNGQLALRGQRHAIRPMDIWAAGGFVQANAWALANQLAGSTVPIIAPSLPE